MRGMRHVTRVAYTRYVYLYNAHSLRAPQYINFIDKNNNIINRSRDYESIKISVIVWREEIERQVEQRGGGRRGRGRVADKCVLFLLIYSIGALVSTHH